jgi:hypothetical protein
MNNLFRNTEIRTIDCGMPKTERHVLRKSSVVKPQGREARARACKKYPTCDMCSMRSDLMFANVCSYAQCESVRQKVEPASMHKIVERRQPRGATNCIEEVVFHW